MKYIAIGYPEDCLPRKELEIEASSKSEAEEKAYHELREYHEVGVYEK